MRDSHKRLKDVCMELNGDLKGGWILAVDSTQVRGSEAERGRGREEGGERGGMI